MQHGLHWNDPEAQALLPVKGLSMKNRNSGPSGGLGGSLGTSMVLGALAVGAAAFGGFLTSRHRDRGSGDAPAYTKRNPDGDLAQVGRTVTIRKPRAELYEYWRDFSHLPTFMENLESVTPGDEAGRSVWTIKAPAGQTVAVETEVSDEIANQSIAWRSVEGSDIRTTGEVRFEDAPGDRGTRVSLVLSYDPPGGALGRTIAKLFLREPQIQARHDLKRFKMLMETGEIATSARTRDDTRAANQQENG